MATQEAAHTSSFLDDDPPAERPWLAPPPGSPPQTSARGTTAKPQKRGHRFEAELEVAELDERGRPSSTWNARGRELDRSSLSFMSRRMCYPGRHVIVAVHLIDATPVPLFGRVAVCEYESDGLCRVELELLEVPEERAVRDWLEGIARRAGGGR